MVAKTGLGVEVADNTGRGTQGVIRSFEKIQRSAQKTAKETGHLDKEFGNLKQNMFGAVGRATLMAGAFTAIAGAAFKATQSALQFNTAMREVSTLLPAGSREVQKIADATLALATQFGTMPTDQAKAAYQIISAGASDAAEATDILTASNKLAIGGVTDITTAADGLTSILNAYGFAASEATSVSDAMFVAMRAGKTTIGELSASIGAVAPLAAQAGVSLEEVLSAVAALTKGGVSTNVAMTGLRQVIAAMVKPTSEAAKLADELNLEFNAAALEAGGLTGVLDEVTRATGGSAEKMALLFGGVEALVPAMALTGKASEDFNDVLNSMETSAGQTEEALNKMLDNPAKKIDILLAKVEVLATRLGNGILDSISPAIDKVIALLTWLEGPSAGNRLTAEQQQINERQKDPTTGRYSFSSQKDVERNIDRGPSQQDIILQSRMAPDGTASGVGTTLGYSDIDIDALFDTHFADWASKLEKEAADEYIANLESQLIKPRLPELPERVQPKEIEMFPLYPMVKSTQEVTAATELAIWAQERFADVSDGSTEAIYAANAALDFMVSMAPEIRPFANALKSMMQGDYFGAAVQGISGLISNLFGTSNSADDTARAMSDLKVSIEEVGRASTSAFSSMLDFGGENTSAFERVRADLLTPFIELYDQIRASSFKKNILDARTIDFGGDRDKALLEAEANTLSSFYKTLNTGQGQINLRKIAEGQGKNPYEWITQLQSLLFGGAEIDWSQLGNAALKSMEEFGTLEDSLIGAGEAARGASEQYVRLARLQENAEEIALRSTLSREVSQAGGDVFQQRAAFKRFEAAIDSLRQSTVARSAGGTTTGSYSGSSSGSSGSVSSGDSVSSGGSASVSTTVTPTVTVNPINLYPDQLVTVPTEEQMQGYYSTSLLPNISNPLVGVLGQVRDNATANKVAFKPWDLFTVPTSAIWEAYWSVFLLKRADTDKHGPDNVAQQVKTNTIAHRTRIDPWDMFAIADSTSFQSFWSPLLANAASRGRQEQSGFYVGGYGPTAVISQVRGNTAAHKWNVRPTDLFSVMGADHFRSFWTNGLHRIVIGDNYGPHAAIGYAREHTANRKWTIAPSDLFTTPSYTEFYNFFTDGYNSLKWSVQWGLFYAMRDLKYTVNLRDHIDFNASGVREAINQAVQDAINDREYDNPFGSGYAG